MARAGSYRISRAPRVNVRVMGCPGAERLWVAASDGDPDGAGVAGPDDDRPLRGHRHARLRRQLPFQHTLTVAQHAYPDTPRRRDLDLELRCCGRGLHWDSRCRGRSVDGWFVRAVRWIGRPLDCPARRCDVDSGQLLPPGPDPQGAKRGQEQHARHQCSGSHAPLVRRGGRHQRLGGRRQRLLERTRRCEPEGRDLDQRPWSLRRRGWSLRQRPWSLRRRPWSLDQRRDSLDRRRGSLDLRRNGLRRWNLRLACGRRGGRRFDRRGGRGLLKRPDERVESSRRRLARGAAALDLLAQTLQFLERRALIEGALSCPAFLHRLS